MKTAFAAALLAAALAGPALAYETGQRGEEYYEDFLQAQNFEMARPTVRGFAMSAGRVSGDDAWCWKVIADASAGRAAQSDIDYCEARLGIE